MVGVRGRMEPQAGAQERNESVGGSKEGAVFSRLRPVIH